MSKFNFTFVLASIALAGASATSCADTVEGCEYTGTCSSSGGNVGEGGGTGKGGGAATGGGGTASGSGGSSGGQGGGAGSGAAGAAGGGGDEGGQGGGAGGAVGEGGTAGGGGQGGEGGQGGQGGQGGSCDETLSPSEAECLVDDAHAIFVAPTGSDQDPGGRDTPVKTLGKALALAGQDKAVIACSAAFAESITLTGGARIYGGFNCPGGKAAAWAYDSTTRTVVAPDVAGPALEVRDVAEAIVIEDVAFHALDGETASESSVAAFVVDSADVTLRRVGLTAGAGADGKSAKNDGFVFPTAAALAGNDGAATTGGAAKTCACLDGRMTRGGSGGDSLSPSGDSGAPEYNTTDGKGGDGSKSCGLGGVGLDGASAPEPAADAKGASILGILTSSGWSPSDGADAGHGAPGQGGGGGAAKPGGGGGGGGCGSCGGKGGKGGTGGGASIALLSVGSSVALVACELTTSDAGKGGNGASGQNGQQTTGDGGIGFGVGLERGCLGGAGGKGSAGGSGGGAAGGLSVGIAYKGNAPTRDSDTLVTTGGAGLAGKGGNVGVNDGIAGVADEERELP